MMNEASWTYLTKDICDILFIFSMLRFLFFQLNHIRT